MEMCVEHHNYIGLNKVALTRQFYIGWCNEYAATPCKVDVDHEECEDPPRGDLMRQARSRAHVQHSFQDLVAVAIIRYRGIVRIGPASLRGTGYPVSTHHHR